MNSLPLLPYQVLSKHRPFRTQYAVSLDFLSWFSIWLLFQLNISASFLHQEKLVLCSQLTSQFLMIFCCYYLLYYFWQCGSLDPSIRTTTCQGRFLDPPLTNWVIISEWGQGIYIFHKHAPWFLSTRSLRPTAPWCGKAGSCSSYGVFSHVCGYRCIRLAP